MRTQLVRLAALVAVVGGGRALADAPCLADADRLCPGIPAGDGRLWACLLRNEFQLSSSCQQNVREVQRRAAEFNADCAPDVYRFCPRMPPGAGRILDCLRVHVGRRELATNCEDAVVTALERLQDFADSCAEDAARLCAGVPAGGGRLFLCLRSQSERLSSRCRRAVSP
ncbi:cysteine rich repeat-containing protein [Anaeromyxobacter oryzae]|uniref:Cysteine rich repeat domain protein n=1 Tax=Anaeromyxobacter oryzae TaxID=2918170 RepID=A0ABN6MXG5_9BACT|nr:cysteine rich repeat-containing protein [Anaeromyxobacter oryzae]BDG05615.1 hypothetical protein AMOR_46110 [Anaeromyxobacter oryzae]